MVGVKIPRVGVKITRGSLTPGGQAAQGVKINCYTGVKRPYEPRSEKTGLQGLRPGPTQTGLYSHRRWLEP